MEYFELGIQVRKSDTGTYEVPGAAIIQDWPLDEDWAIVEESPIRGWSPWERAVTVRHYRRGEELVMFVGSVSSDTLCGVCAREQGAWVLADPGAGTQPYTTSAGSPEWGLCSDCAAAGTVDTVGGNPFIGDLIGG